MDQKYSFSFVVPHLKVCGGNRRYLEMANRLISLGHEVIFFPYEKGKCDWFQTQAEIKNYDQILKQKHQIILHSFYSFEELKTVKQASADLKIFYVLHLYEKELMVGFHPLLYWRNEKTRGMKKNILSSQLILTNSSWQHDWIKNNLHTENYLLLGGINFDLFHPIEVRKDSNKIKIIYSGDRRGWKNTKLIESAINLLKEKYSNLESDFYYDKNLPQEKMAEFYSAGDIFVDAQIYGGWNNPVVEAMACGVPVVCSNIGSVKDFAINNQTALLFESDNLNDLVVKIEKLINDQNLRVTLAKNALDKVKELSWDKSINEFLKIVKQYIK